MPANGGYISSKQLRHLLLREPDGVLVRTDLELDGVVGILIERDLL